MKFILLTAFVFFVSACTHNPNEVVAVEKDGKMYMTDELAAEALAEGDNDQVICERRVVTGSHRIARVCTTKEQKRKDRDEAREIMDKSGLLKSREMVPLDN